MISALIIKMIGGIGVAGKSTVMVSEWVPLSFIKLFIRIQSDGLYHEASMYFILKIFIISIVTVVSLFIGGWIASRIIKMDNRNNLIDW